MASIGNWYQYYTSKPEIPDVEYTRRPPPRNIDKRDFIEWLQLDEGGPRHIDVEAIQHLEGRAAEPERPVLWLCEGWLHYRGRDSMNLSCQDIKDLYLSEQEREVATRRDIQVLRNCGDWDGAMEYFRRVVWPERRADMARFRALSEEQKHQELNQIHEDWFAKLPEAMGSEEELSKSKASKSNQFKFIRPRPEELKAKVVKRKISKSKISSPTLQKTHFDEAIDAWSKLPSVKREENAATGPDVPYPVTEFPNEKRLYPYPEELLDCGVIFGPEDAIDQTAKLEWTSSVSSSDTSKPSSVEDTPGVIMARRLALLETLGDETAQEVVNRHVVHNQAISDEAAQWSEYPPSQFVSQRPANISTVVPIPTSKHGLQLPSHIAPERLFRGPEWRISPPRRPPNPAPRSKPPAIRRLEPPPTSVRKDANGGNGKTKPAVPRQARGREPEGRSRVHEHLSDNKPRTRPPAVTATGSGDKGGRTEVSMKKASKVGWAGFSNLFKGVSKAHG